MGRTFLKIAPPPEITTESRKASRDSARKNMLVPQRWRRYPIVWAIEVATAAGLPLEAVRWLNRNKHKPGHFFKHTLRRHKLWPPNLWDQFRLATHRVSPAAYAVADLDELKAFVSRLKVVKSKYGTTERRLGKWWVSEPHDHTLNREIVEPKTNPSYLDGAVGLRFDDYFWSFAVLPYQFREIPLETLVSTLFPDMSLDDVEFLPDDGTPGQAAYFQDRRLRIDAYRVLEQRAPEGWGDLKLVPDGDGGYEATFLTEAGERLFTDHISMAEIIAGNAKFGITV